MARPGFEAGPFASNAKIEVTTSSLFPYENAMNPSLMVCVLHLRLIYHGIQKPTLYFRPPENLICIYQVQVRVHTRFFYWDENTISESNIINNINHKHFWEVEHSSVFLEQTISEMTKNLIFL